LQKVVSPPKPPSGGPAPAPVTPICEVTFQPAFNTPFFSATASAFLGVLRDFSFPRAFDPCAPN
jgi:hypothetical protein